MEESPLLSVCLITYNHVKYIREAIEGVLIQKVNFTWELIIADDYSNDGTRDILLEFKEKYPNFIKLILQKENVGASQNWLELLEAPKSKYIAYFEGDDYWTDPYKLQKQVDFLEENKEYAACFHDVVNVDGFGEIVKYKSNLPTLKSYNQEQALMLLKSSQATCSMVFRTLVVKRKFPKWFINNSSDFTLDLLITEYGLIGYIPRNMAAYRIHSGGVWQGTSYLNSRREHLNRLLKCYSDLSFRRKYKIYLRKIITEISFEIYNISLLANDLKIAKKYLLLYIRFNKSIKPLKINYTCKYVLFPKSYSILLKVLKGR